MTNIAARSIGAPPIHWSEFLPGLCSQFAESAEAADDKREFVAINLAQLKHAGLLAAAAPSELGGGGCGQTELGEMLRLVARSCGSTALTLSMHMHLVAALGWRWRRDPAATGPLLTRVVQERLQLVSTGGSDWIDGSGSAEPAKGGYLVTGRKMFASGAPSGDLLMTSAVLEGPDASRTVLHFPLPLDAEGVRLVDSWRTLGMRGTGSWDVEFSGIFVAEDQITTRRPAGRWHPAIHLVTKMSFPLIYSVYLGIAEAARDRAVEIAAKRHGNTDLEHVIGELETQLASARLAIDEMIRLSDHCEPGADTTNRMMMCRTLAERGVIGAVDLAMEAAGGAGFYCRAGLERLFRDIQAARYHPLQNRAQARFAGRHALGRDVDGGDRG